MAANSTCLELSVDTYATFESIQALIPLRVLTDYTTAPSQPTKTQASEIVRDIFQQINGVLSVLGYSVPVASGNGTSMRILGRLQALGSAASIEDAAYSAGNVTRSDYADSLHSQFNLLWKTFKAGEIEIIGAARKANYFHRQDERLPSYEMHVVSGSESSPDFTKDMSW